MVSRVTRRPVAVLVCTVAVAVFGALAARELPVDLLPDVSYPTLTIQTEYPDAAPVSVERFVTRPIEEAVGVIQGVRDLRSTSRAGLSEVVLELEWGEPLDLRALDVREKLGTVELPREAEPPRVLRYDPGLDPVLRLGLSGPVASGLAPGEAGREARERREQELDELRRLAERFLEPRLEAVRGVAAARVRGGRDPEIVVEADEDRLAAHGLVLADLSRALQAEDVNLPAGTLEDMGSVFLVRTLHELRDLEAIRATVLRETPQGRVRIGDVAEVRRTGKDQEEATRDGGRETVEIAVHREGSANVLAVAAAVRAEVEVLQKELRPGLTLNILSDQSGAIGMAVDEVESSALLGGLLTVLVLWFFLRDARATAVIGLTIPISVLATLLLMRQASVSLNVMSLGGLALGIGMLVDNSIVVLEAIDRHRRMGRPRLEAAIHGAGEVAAAVTSSTLTTVAVFFPVVFVHGIAGQLFRDLALTVCASLLASLAVALTLMPALAGLSAGGREPAPGPAPEPAAQQPELVVAARAPGALRLGPVWLPAAVPGEGLLARGVTQLLLPLRALTLIVAVILLGLGWCLTWAFHALSAPLARALEAVGRAYPRLVTRALRARHAVLAAAGLLFGLALLIVPRLPTQLLPDLNRGEFAFRLRWPEGTPLETTSQVLERIEAPLLGDPRFARVFSVAGSLPAAGLGRQTLGENLAQLDLVLAGAARGDAAAEAAAVARVREVLAGFPGVVAERVQPTLLSLAPQVEVLIYADDLELLERSTEAVELALARVPGLADVGSTREPGSPEVRIEVDRERAAALGVAAEVVGEALRRQIRGEVVAKLREEEDRIDLRLRAAPRYRARTADLGALRVPLANGGAVPVSSVARVEVTRGPAAIHRSSGGRVARVSASAPVRDLGRLQDAVRAALARLELPPGAVAELAGQDQELSASLQSLQAALALAVFLVFVVLAVQFESLLQPFVVLLTVPLAVVGVVGALVLTGTPLGVLPLMGTVVLAGIAVNNSIVLVDAINRRRSEGQALDAALAAAGRERLRPILMTTLTTVLALLPMALDGGAGSELRRPLALALLGGLSASTVLTLVVTPCTYRLLIRVREPAP